LPTTHSPCARSSTLLAGDTGRLGFCQGFHQFLDAEKHRCLKRAKCASSTDSERYRRHRYVVGRLPQIPTITFAKGVPEPVQLASDRLDVGTSGLAPILRRFNQTGPGFGRIAEA
jgi:hypothetical protein